MPPTIDALVETGLERLSPAERRVARYLQTNPAEALIASAAALARRTQTSDATVVRTAKALGFAGLDELRQALAEKLGAAASPAERLSRTLQEVGDSLPAAFETTLQIHQQSLESLRGSIRPEEFERAVGAIAAARRVAVFGIGPSSAIASYLAIQLGRFGLDGLVLANTGLLFADDLRRLREGDLVVLLAYGRVYPELATLLDEAERRRLPTLLLTDTLAAELRHRVDLVLPVPRGRVDLLSMHTATLGLVEALLVGVATRRPAETLASLEELNGLRRRLGGSAMPLPAPDGPSGQR